jgi:hypothetical protein
METVRTLLALLFLAVLSGGASASGGIEHTLLLQLEEGHFKVWFASGPMNPSDEELLDLEASAKPEGGKIVRTSAGPAQATDVKEGVWVTFPGAVQEDHLLVLRDACGGVKAWHSAGVNPLSEDEMTDLAVAAVAGGSKRIAVRAGYAKSFSGRAGVMVVIWTSASQSQFSSQH